MKPKKTNPYKVGDRVYFYNSQGKRSDYTIRRIDGDFTFIGENLHEVAQFYHGYWKGKLKPKKKLSEEFPNLFLNHYVDSPWGNIHLSKNSADNNRASSHTACVEYKAIRVWRD